MTVAAPAVAGALWGGHGIATMDLTVALSPRRDRPFYLAVFATAGGLGFTAAAVTAGMLASRLPAHLDILGDAWTPLHVLFCLSALARPGASLAALRIEEPGARDVRSAVRAMLGLAAAMRVPRRLTS